MSQYRYQNPVNQPWNVTSNTGNRVDPVFGYSASHKGIDIAIPVGTPVMAAASGRVMYSQVDKSSSGGFGNYIVIKHDDGTYTTYGHLSARDVKIGQKIEIGGLIGLSGNTGKSTGPHLHFQITEGDPLKSGYKVINPTEVTNGIKSQPLSLPIDSQGFLLDSHGNRLLLADSGQIATDGYYTTDKNSTTNNSNSTNPLDSADNQLTNPLGDNTNSTNDNQSQSDQEKTQDQIIKDALASEDAKQTATFMGELQSQLPSMMGIMAARLAMGEDIKLVSADMASRLIATSAINTYAENHWAENGGRSSLEASAANAVASYAVTILITNAFSGDNMNREDYKLAAMNISIQTITSEVVKYVGQTAIRESAKAAGYTTTAQITQYVTLNAYEAAIASGATEAAAKAAGEKAASQFGAISPVGAGVVAAITYIGFFALKKREQFIVAGKSQQKQPKRLFLTINEHQPKVDLFSKKRQQGACDAVAGTSRLQAKRRKAAKCVDANSDYFLLNLKTQNQMFARNGAKNQMFANDNLQVTRAYRVGGYYV